jgi:hypothetical protein
LHAVAGGRFVLGPLDLAVTQAIGLVEPGLDLLLDSKREFEGHRRDGLDQQRADGGIDLCRGCLGGVSGSPARPGHT